MHFSPARTCVTLSLMVGERCLRVVVVAMVGVAILGRWWGWLWWWGWGWWG